MSRVLVAPIVPPYRDPGGLLLTAMMRTIAEPIEVVITSDPVRFRHLDKSQPAPPWMDSPTLQRLSCEATAPPEAWESLEHFVTHAVSVAPADLTEIWASTTSVHSLAAAAALRRRSPTATLVLLAPTWIDDLPPLRGTPPDELPDLWGTLDTADEVICPAEATVRALSARWAGRGERPRVRRMRPGSDGPGSRALPSSGGSAHLRILYVDDGSGPWALRQLGTALELMPDTLSAAVHVEVIGERPPAVTEWMPSGCPVNVSTSVVSDHAGRRAHRSACDLVYAAERSREGGGLSIAWTWADGWDGRPVLATGPRDGILAELVGHTPLPDAHATALAYAVATAVGRRTFSDEV